MDEARTERAKSRIEDALARIERALAGAPPVSEGGWNAHHALKARVKKALGELDHLIADLER
jgi:hypothetical protein